MAKDSTKRKRQACGFVRELLERHGLSVAWRGGQDLCRSDFTTQTARLRACDLTAAEVRQLQLATTLYSGDDMASPDDIPMPAAEPVEQPPAAGGVARGGSTSQTVVM